VSRIGTEQQRTNKGRFGTSRKKCKPHTIGYLAKAWGVSRDFPMNNNVTKGNAVSHTTTKRNPVQQSVIDSVEAAQIQPYGND
jgi:hypothetical protein